MNPAQTALIAFLALIASLPAADVAANAPAIVGVAVDIYNLGVPPTPPVAPAVKRP